VLNIRRGVWLLAVTGAIIISGCNSSPERPADVVIAGAHSGGSALSTSPDSRLVASGGWSGRIRLWHLPDGTPAGGWQAHRDSVNGIVFLGDGSRLLSAGFDGRMAIWNLAGHRLQAWDTGSPVTALSARRDRAVLATGHADGSVRLWDAEGRVLRAWPGVHRNRVREVALSDRGDAIASAGTDGRVYWWTYEGSPERLDDPPSDARALLFSQDGDTLIGAGWFRLFRWGLPDGGLSSMPTDHAGIINDLEFLPDGRLASISRQTDSAVLLLDAATGTTLQRLQRHELCGVAVSPSPDGRFLATTSDDASVRIWQLDDSSRRPEHR
jgi:WD40 repeat protein